MSAISLATIFRNNGGLMWRFEAVREINLSRGSSMSELLVSSVEELKRLLTETASKDYVYEGYYMDAKMKIRRGRK